MDTQTTEKTASKLPTCNTGSISITKSSGLEEINTRILVDAFTSIPELLDKFYNFSLKNSQIPACLKISKFTPLPQKGDVTLLNNLRPIFRIEIQITQILHFHLQNQVYDQTFMFILISCIIGSFCLVSRKLLCTETKICTLYVNFISPSRYILTDI